MSCSIGVSRVEVGLKGSPEALVKGEWHDTVKADDMIWSVEDDGDLIITIEKSRSTWWECLVKVSSSTSENS